MNTSGGRLLRSYFVIAVRNLLRHRVYSAINLLGLAIGMAVCCLILLFVRYELDWDQDHPQVDQLYRILRETRRPNGTKTTATLTSGPLGPTILKTSPEVDAAVRMNRWSTWTEYGDFGRDEGIALVDPSFLTVLPPAPSAGRSRDGAQPSLHRRDHRSNGSAVLWGR